MYDTVHKDVSNTYANFIHNAISATSATPCGFQALQLLYVTAKRILCYFHEDVSYVQLSLLWKTSQLSFRRGSDGKMPAHRVSFSNGVNFPSAYSRRPRLIAASSALVGLHVRLDLTCRSSSIKSAYTPREIAIKSLRPSRCLGIVTVVIFSSYQKSGKKKG